MAICTSGPQHRQANAQIGRAESIVTVGGSGIVDSRDKVTRRLNGKNLHHHA